MININEACLDLESSSRACIEIAQSSQILIENLTGNERLFKTILFMGLPENVKGYNNISHKYLSDLRTKFRVNYEQAVVYKIIEKINFYDFLVIFTRGMDLGGIDYLIEIKVFFEFRNKKIFIIKERSEGVFFQAK